MRVDCFAGGRDGCIDLTSELFLAAKLEFQSIEPNKEGCEPFRAALGWYACLLHTVNGMSGSEHRTRKLEVGRQSFSSYRLFSIHVIKLKLVLLFI